MGVRELKAKYGAKTNTTQAFNRAIRAEIPGGADVLDALDLIGRAPKRAETDEIIERLRRAKAAMAAVVAARYDLASSRTNEANATAKEGATL